MPPLPPRSRQKLWTKLCPMRSKTAMGRIFRRPTTRKKRVLKPHRPPKMPAADAQEMADQYDAAQSKAQSLGGSAVLTGKLFSDSLITSRSETTQTPAAKILAASTSSVEKELAALDAIETKLAPEITSDYDKGTTDLATANVDFATGQLGPWLLCRPHRS